MNAETLKGHLELLLLSVIGDAPRHGYAIAQALRARSRELFDLPEGTLYPALHRIERAGLISGKWSAIDGRRRRVYQLTAKGRKALDERQSDWNAFASAVYAVVGGRA